MSASDTNSAIFVNDTPKSIKTKINSFAFSGGRATAEEQRAKGANLDVDVPWNSRILNPESTNSACLPASQFFMEDDVRLAQIGADYGSGKMLTGEVKAELIQVLIDGGVMQVLTDMVSRHQEARSRVTEAVVDAFMAVRPMALMS